jgi:hypothetical protein
MARKSLATQSKPVQHFVQGLGSSTSMNTLGFSAVAIFTVATRAPIQALAHANAATNTI